MKRMLIAANWKSNKTKNEANSWLEEFISQELDSRLEVIIFPPFTLLDFVSEFVKNNNLPFKIGAQNLSPFESGSHTGEVSATQIKEFADYVLIGHSERRDNFLESNELVTQKIEKALKAGIIPIVCVSELFQLEGTSFDRETVIVYEPIWAIGTGNPESPEETDKFAKELEKRGFQKVLYGGSVDASNVNNYLHLDSISGVLIGGASLNASTFSEVLKNAI